MMQVLSYAGTVGVQVLILYILIFVGVALTKGKLLTERGAKELTDVILYASTPLVIIKAFSDVEFSSESLSRLGIMVVCTVVTHFIALGVGLFCFRRCDDRLKKLLTAGVMFSNCGFMSLPLTAAVLGDEGVFLVSVYIAVFNVFLWTIGLMLFSDEKLSVRKIFINPGIIGVLVGLVIFFFGIPLPDIIYDPIRHLANLNTPLAMIVIGYYLATSSLRIRRGDGRMFAAIGLRMVIVPLIIFVLCRLVGITGISLSACIIPASAPTAAVVMMFAAKFDGDTTLASRMVSISHVLSVLTMPLLLTMCEFLG
jgi:predicted permease